MENINKRKRINVSIAIILIWLFCLAVYLTFIFLIKISYIHTILIISSITILNLMMWIFFMIKIEWLKDIKTGKEITCMNISNVLSAIRFTLVPLLIIMFGLIANDNGHFYFKIGIFIFTVMVTLTDLIDGMLARKLHEETKLGKILDPFGDFLMITCFAVLIYINQIIEWWFFLLIIIRIPGLIVVAIIMISLEIKIKFKTTIFGKATIFYILCILGLSTIELLLKLNIFSYNIFLFVNQIICSVLIVISSTEKILQLKKLLNEQKQMQIKKDNIQF